MAEQEHNSVGLKTTAHATAHCLTGCVIGEVAGLAIGVSLGWAAWQTITLAVALAFISGLTLATAGVMRRHKSGFVSAFQSLWLGECISISAMEIAMNWVDWALGGASAHSVISPVFWVALAFAIPAGYIAAFPVNYVLLRRNLKHCH